MSTILQPIHFRDSDSKDCVGGTNSVFYRPFSIDPAVAAGTEGDILTGVTSGAKIVLLEDLSVDDFEMFAKVISGEPDEAGEDWQNTDPIVLATGTGGVDEGRNVYLVLGDDYYGKLLRDNGIDPTNVGLVLPPILQIREAMVAFVEMDIFKDLIDDSRAPFDGQTILIDKYRDKLKNAEKCWKKWLTDIDENAFFDLEKGDDSLTIGVFLRG